MTDHVWDIRTMFCIACGRSQMEQETTPIACSGTLAYREYLLGSTWVRAPIARPRQ